MMGSAAQHDPDLGPMGWPRWDATSRTRAERPHFGEDRVFAPTTESIVRMRTLPARAPAPVIFNCCIAGCGMSHTADDPPDRAWQVKIGGWALAYRGLHPGDWATIRLDWEARVGDVVLASTPGRDGEEPTNLLGILCEWDERCAGGGIRQGLRFDGPTSMSLTIHGVPLTVIGPVVAVQHKWTGAAQRFCLYRYPPRVFHPWKESDPADRARVEASLRQKRLPRFGQQPAKRETPDAR